MEGESPVWEELLKYIIKEWPRIGCYDLLTVGNTCVSGGHRLRELKHFGLRYKFVRKNKLYDFSETTIDEIREILYKVKQGVARPPQKRRAVVPSPRVVPVPQCRGGPSSHTPLPPLTSEPSGPVYMTKPPKPVPEAPQEHSFNSEGVGKLF